jgi:hypothetical protein
LFYYISTAADARQNATVQATKSKRTSAFKTWQTFLNRVGLTESLYLDGFNSFQRNIIFSAFAQAIRTSAFSSRNNRDLVEGTVQSTLSYVAQAFGANNRPDPRLDTDGKTCFMLQEQARAYRNQDASRKKQKALPMMVLRKLNELAQTPWQQATATLLIGAIFFAMRSCEYLATNTPERERRTRILRLRNIIFKKQGITVPHSSHQLELADIVMIVFEFQKNDKRDVQIHMFKTSDDVLNPVIAWAKTVKRVWSYPNATADLKVCHFLDQNGKLCMIKANDVRDWLRATVSLIGEDVLGFTAEDIGLHSIRSGGAMAMFLSKTSTIIMMRVGRWSSEAFLEYIREQVQDFTVGISENMLEFESFMNMNRNQPIDLKLASTNNENGPETIPFQIEFSQLALTNDRMRLFKKK